jgi:hypothetical protein
MKRSAIVLALTLALGGCGSSDKSDKPSTDGSGSVDPEAARKAAALRAEQARVANEQHALDEKVAHLNELSKQLDDLGAQARDAMQAIENTTNKDDQQKAQERLEDLTRQRAALQQEIQELRVK